MMHRLQMYMADFGENIEKEGDATKNYQALKTRITEDMAFAHDRLESQRKYDENPNPPMNDDGERLDCPPMTEEEVAETKQFLVEAQELVDDLNELIGDELSHTVKLVAIMVKYGCVSVAQDGLAQSLLTIAKPQEGDDGNGSN